MCLPGPVGRASNPLGFAVQELVKATGVNMKMADAIGTVTFSH